MGTVDHRLGLALTLAKFDNIKSIDVSRVLPLEINKLMFGKMVSYTLPF